MEKPHMRRSICYCDPNHAQAGEVKTWKFIYTTANPLSKGTLIKFDPKSDGRPIDWEVPEASAKKTANTIYLQLDNGKTLNAKVIELEDRFTPQYEFTLNTDIKTGENITIVMGAPKNAEPDESNGNMAQCMTQRRRNFYLYIDPTAKGHYSDPEVFTMDIRGNILHHIRILVPSFVNKNKRFDIIARFEDEFGNLTSNAPPETLIKLSYENIRENLNWKLFIPETGFITLPNLYFNEAGIYTITLSNLATGEDFKGPPVKCFADSPDQLFWGTVHGESDRIDSAENIENCLRHFRDEKAYHYFVTSPFESQEETSSDIWKLNVQNVAEFDEPDRFTTLLGFQWAGSRHSEGIRQFIYAKDSKPIIRKKDIKGTTLKKIYKAFSPKEMIAVPTFTMSEGNEYNFNNFDPEFERVVEIYNAWGSSECTKAEGNPLPITTSGKSGSKEAPEGSIVAALNKNLRFGFVAGGLDDRGIYSNFYDSDQEQYTAGLTAIIAPEQNRASMFDALYRRSCYATTGERIIVGFNIAGKTMGGEINTADKPGLTVNRHIAGYVAGTTNIKTIEIIRNGKVIHTIKPDNVYHQNFEFDDMSPINKVYIDNKDKKPPFIYYYIRVTQEDGHIAWSSPIWIDHVELSESERKAKKIVKPAKAMTAKESFGNDSDFALLDRGKDEDEDDEDDIDDDEDVSDDDDDDDEDI
jgi:S-adenosylmethionine hydrolase